MHKYTISHFETENIITIITSTILTIVTPFHSFMNEILKLFNINYSLPDDLLYKLLIGYSLYFGILYKIVVCKFLWKTRLFKFIFNIPNLNGDWKIIGESINKKYQKNYPWEGTLKINQTLKTISVTLVTANSFSESVSEIASISTTPDGNYLLNYVFSNTPNNNAPSDMRAHKGACEIKFNKNEESGEGNYFSNNRDRETSGTMKLDKVSKK